MKEKILIVGGGVAGLMAKNRLEAQGYRPVLAEKADAIRTGGTGLLLAANVMKILSETGHGDRVLKKARSLDALVSTDDRGRVLARIDLRKIRDRTGHASIAIHRPELHNILLGSVDRESLWVSHRLVALNQKQGGFETRFENGREEYFDWILGTDGLHSKVREELFGPVGLRHTKQACWRVVIDAPPGVDPSIGYEMWGNRKRTGIIPLGEGKLYLFLVASILGEESSMSSESVIHLFDEFEGPWIPVREALHSTKPEMIYGELADAQRITMTKDGVVLLGDAAHSTTPNLGQGAAMGIESAYHFGELLKNGTFQDAIADYVSKRSRKVQKIRDKSMRMGELAHIKSPVLQLSRNWILRRIPDRLIQREFEHSIFRD